MAGQFGQSPPAAASSRNSTVGADRIPSKYKKDDGWCSKSLLRNYLYIFNFFLLIGGMIVLGVGVWSILAEHTSIALLSPVTYPLTSYLLVIAGVVVIVAVIIGCWGIKHKDRCYILVYIILLLLVFLLEAKAGILAYIYRGQAFNDLQVHLNETYTEFYGIDPTKTNEIDDIQKEFHCCGVLSFWNWDETKWKQSGLAKNNLVPDSCCISFGPNCGVRNHPSNIYTVGCLYKLLNVITDHLGYLAIAGLGLCILQVFGIIFSICLYIKLKEPDIADL